MKKERQVRDQTGKILYYIVEEDGVESVYDRTGKLIGWTNKNGSTIYNTKYVGTGGSALIISEHEKNRGKK